VLAVHQRILWRINRSVRVGHRTPHHPFAFTFSRKGVESLDCLLFKHFSSEDGGSGVFKREHLVVECFRVSLI
jgi:hypothetical protein